jgi:hypothetical protein
MTPCRPALTVWLAAALAGVAAAEPPLPHRPAPVPDAKPLPINLPTALRLAGVNPLDIAVATERLNAAAA